MRRLFALPLFILALAIPATAETRGGENPELRYYADAYADHYGGPARACACHHRPGVKLEPSCAVDQRRGRPDAADAGDGGRLPRQGPLFYHGKSQRWDSIPCGSHDRVSRGNAPGRSRILLRFTANRSTRTALPKSRCRVLRRSGPPPISAGVARASKPGYSNARERTVTCIQSGQLVSSAFLQAQF